MDNGGDISEAIAADLLENNPITGVPKMISDELTEKAKEVEKAFSGRIYKMLEIANGEE